MYRVAIDSRELQGGVGGLSTYLSNLVRFYNEPDMKFHMAVKEKIGTLPDNFQVDLLKMPFLYSNATWTNLVLLPYLLKNKFDLYHSPFFTLPLIKPCKMVLTVHDVIFEKHPEWFPAKNLLSFRLLTRTAVKSADMLIADSHSTKEDLIKCLRVPEEKIEVVHLAPGSSFRVIEDRKAVSEVMARYGIDNSYILYVSNLGTRKNIVRLVKAFELLKEGERNPHKLVLVGSAGYGGEAALKAIEVSPFKRDIIYIRRAEENDLICLYNGADVFVYPSLYEGFGLPVLEAFACGAPVVTSNVSSMPEIAGNAAEIIDPNSVKDIADKIGRVLSDRQLREGLKEKGSKRVREFTWGKTAKQTISIYRTVLRS